MTLHSEFDVIGVTQKPSTPPQSQLRWANGNNINIDGSTIEASIKIADKVLIFATEDCPFEEALHITLVTSKGEVQDEVAIAADYSTGCFTLISHDEHTATFSFFEGLIYQVSIFQTPKLVLFNRARYVTRKRRLLTKSHLRFSCSEIK